VRVWPALFRLLPRDGFHCFFSFRCANVVSFVLERKVRSILSIGFLIVASLSYLMSGALLSSLQFLPPGYQGTYKSVGLVSCQLQV
jgi:hypothetical protein